MSATFCTFLVEPRSMAIHGLESSELDTNVASEFGSVMLNGKKIGLRRIVFARSPLLEAKTSTLSEKR